MASADGTGPSEVRSTTDPGDATSRNFRYQHAYGVMLLIAAKQRRRPYVAIWCEQHDDFLAERDDGTFDAYQIKTARPERGAWRLADGELTKSIGRFVDLVNAFDNHINRLYFVSNTEVDEVSPSSNDQRRRGRCPRLFLEHVRDCGSRAEIQAPFDAAFDDLQATCGCEEEELLTVLHRMDFVLGPSRTDFDAALSHEHLARLEECSAYNADQLDAVRDQLVGAVYRASSLQVTDPIRHLRALIAPEDGDPVLAAKRIIVEDIVVGTCSIHETPGFSFPGEPTLELGAGLSANVIEQKFARAGPEHEIDYMRQRALAAEYNLLEDLARRPEGFSELLRQIEQHVHGEVSEAYLRARQGHSPYGPAMLIDVQDRLRRLAQDRPEDVGHHRYECLIGIAGLLTSQCRVWWGPRFPIGPETAQ